MRKGRYASKKKSGAYEKKLRTGGGKQVSAASHPAAEMEILQRRK
jgi:hypothetical protein